MQIIVLGAPRSGASLATRLLNMMGASFDSGPPSIGFANDKPKGFWENPAIVAENDRLLKAQGAEWYRLSSWEFPAPNAPVKGGDEEIARLAKGLGAEGVSVSKDPRLCLTYPFWKKHLSKPILILVQRSPGELALSLKKRYGFSLAHGLAIAEYYTIGMLRAARDQDVICITHHELAHEPQKLISRLLSALNERGATGLKLPDPDELNAFIDSSLHRSKEPEDSKEAMLTPRLAALYAMSLGETPVDPALLEPTASARDAMTMAGKRLAAEEKMRHAHENFAASDQMKNEIENELSQFRLGAQAEIHRLEALVERYKQHLLAIQHSRSWQLGSRLVRLFSKAESTALPS